MIQTYEHALELVKRGQDGTSFKLAPYADIRLEENGSVRFSGITINKDNIVECDFERWVHVDDFAYFGIPAIEMNAHNTRVFNRNKDPEFKYFAPHAGKLYPIRKGSQFLFGRFLNPKPQKVISDKDLKHIRQEASEWINQHFPVASMLASQDTADTRTLDDITIRMQMRLRHGNAPDSVKREGRKEKLNQLLESTPRTEEFVLEL